MVERHSATPVEIPKEDKEDDIDEFISNYSSTNTKLFDDFKGKLPEKVIANISRQNEHMVSFKEEVLQMGMNAFNIT